MAEGRDPLPRVGREGSRHWMTHPVTLKPLVMTGMTLMTLFQKRVSSKNGVSGEMTIFGHCAGDATHTRALLRGMRHLRHTRHFQGIMRHWKRHSVTHAS